MVRRCFIRCLYYFWSDYASTPLSKVRQMISLHVGEFFEGLVGNEMQIYEGSKRFNITRDYGKNWFVTRAFCRRTWWWIYEPAWGTICLLKYVTRESFLSFRENLKIYLKSRAQAGSFEILPSIHETGEVLNFSYQSVWNLNLNWVYVMLIS